ncbi:TPA: hypothetical protein ACRZZI_003713 [Vibrio harveyi]|uniref:hypothetical protein n=1 Tax=Vibrio harveyi TaxID=669 RepID=UPI001C972D98|nr:hypothetical protein [Vibrio harveyi]MBY6236816.1 hypothetical protein [Vibrio harveyi]
MNKAPLIMLLMVSACAHAATADDANSALLENIARFDKYEQTAREMSSGQSDLIQVNQQQNQTASSEPALVMPATAPQIKQTATPETASSSVYQSIKILIESGTLTDKEKIKLISALSS